MSWILENKLVLIVMGFIIVGLLTWWMWEVFDRMLIEEAISKQGKAEETGWTTPFISEHKKSFWESPWVADSVNNIDALDQDIKKALSEYKKIYPDREIDIRVRIEARW